MEIKEIKKNTYCNGYFYNKVNRYLKYENDCFKLYGDGLFNYVDIIRQPCYDVDGKYLGTFESENIYEKEEVKKPIEPNYCVQVIQLNYNFFKIEHGGNTMNEISSFESILENSNLIKTNDWSSNCRFDSNEISNQFFTGKLKTSSYEPYEPIEICYTGHSQRITNTVNKKLYDLDINKYTKRKNNFIKNNPELKEYVENIYMHNIVYLMKFWNKNKKQLNKFEKVNNTIQKLNRKITSKFI